jgi:hypothetical protein
VIASNAIDGGCLKRAALIEHRAESNELPLVPQSVCRYSPPLLVVAKPQLGLCFILIGAGSNTEALACQTRGLGPCVSAAPRAARRPRERPSHAGRDRKAVYMSVTITAARIRATHRKSCAKKKHGIS